MDDLCFEIQPSAGAVPPRPLQLVPTRQTAQPDHYATDEELVGHLVVGRHRAIAVLYRRHAGRLADIARADRRARVG